MILVTGGTGFLGSYILQNLVSKGLRVRAIRRSSQLPFYIPAGILEQVEWVEGDVLDTVSLQDAMKDVDAIVHAAAIVSFSRQQRRDMYQVNVEGTTNVVNTAIDLGVRRMLYVSSVAALGRTVMNETVSEEKKWETSSVNTHYAISKHLAEMQVWRGFAEGLDGVVINPSTILGFGNWHQSSCAIFRNAYREFAWYTNGINGFVGVEDVAEAAVRLLQSDCSQQKFIVSAENWHFRQLFDTIADGFHKKRPNRHASKTMGALAWRMEKFRSMVTGSKPLLTKETAKLAHSKTSFNNSKLLRELPGFSFMPLKNLIQTSCEKYEDALQKGLLTL